MTQEINLRERFIFLIEVSFLSDNLSFCQVDIKEARTACCLIQGRVGVGAAQDSPCGLVLGRPCVFPSHLDDKNLRMGIEMPGELKSRI